MTQAPTNLGSQAGQPWCEGEQLANNARNVHGTKGLFFTQSMRGHLVQLLLSPHRQWQEHFYLHWSFPRLLSLSPR